MAKRTKSTKRAKPVLTRRTAICQFYEPFRFGSPWFFVRYEVEAEDVELIKGFQGFLFRNPGGRYLVHELATGGYLGDGHTRVAAIFHANKNIDETPNLKAQMEALGDSAQWPLVETAEAFRRLAKQAD